MGSWMLCEEHWAAQAWWSGCQHGAWGEGTELGGAEAVPQQLCHMPWGGSWLYPVAHLTASAEALAMSYMG